MPTTAAPAYVHIRWMIRRDLDAVLDIEGRAFDSPWTEEDFLRCLRQRNCIGMVAEGGPGGERVDGFMIYELHKHKLVLLNFAVDPQRHRQGVGRAMLNKLKAKLSDQRRTRIEFLVGERNMVGHLFLAAEGFRATGVERQPFGEWSDEDGYRFVFRLEDA